MDFSSIFSKKGPVQGAQTLQIAQSEPGAVEAAQAKIQAEISKVEAREHVLAERIGALTTERTSLARSNDWLNLQQAQAYSVPVAAPDQVAQLRKQGGAILERVKSQRGEAVRRREGIEAEISKLRREKDQLGERVRTLKKWASGIDALRASGVKVAKLEIEI